jgi:hypothetical protein
MRTSKVVWFAAALAGLFAVGTSTRADSIPWGYSASSGDIFNSNNGSKSSTVSFAGASGVASGDSGIIIYNVTANSTAASGAADSFSNVPFNFAVTLTDVKGTGSASASAKASDTVSFAGLFNASNVTTKSLLPGANSWTSPTTANLVLGADDVGWRNYSVQLTSLTPPGQPGGAPGSVQAVVTITPVGGEILNGQVPPPDGQGGPPTTATPEPTTLVLAGFGLPFIVLLRRMKKNQQA